MTIDWTKPIETFDGVALRWHEEGQYVTRKDGGDIEWGGGYGYQRVYINPHLDHLGWDGNRPPIRNVASEATDELIQLRAFRDEAIKRFPELAPVEPVDPDIAEAHMLTYCHVRWFDLDKSVVIDHAESLCIKAIKRGRELERYAQGLTTPKD